MTVANFSKLALLTTLVCLLVLLSQPKPQLFGNAQDGVFIHYEEGIPHEHTIVTVTKGGREVFKSSARVIDQRIEAIEYEMAVTDHNRQGELDALKAMKREVGQALKSYPNPATTTKRLPAPEDY